MHKTPLLIDEVQYAPELFSYIKIAVDSGVSAGSFWLTGSQQFKLMELAGESLAGRAAIMSLSSLSQAEINGIADVGATGLTFDINFWQERSRMLEPKTTPQIYKAIFNGGMPRLVSGEAKRRSVYYSSYVQTFIERDVRNLLGEVDAVQYMDFMRAVMARVGQMVNVASIAAELGIRAEKVRAWLAVLERAGVIFYLHPYSNNQLKRTVKAPKLYCHDCGLVAYLAKWSSAETLSVGAMAGAIFENFVVSEIYKRYQNAGEEPLIYYYRDHDAKEIDIVIESDGELHPIEIKRAANVDKSMTRAFSVLDKASIPRGLGAVICCSDALGAIDSRTLVIPAWML
jgi:hypothetical protein